MSRRAWAIDGVGKGLGGSYLADAQVARNAAAPDDGLLRDTAKELEQLFDEFQSLRNSITQPDGDNHPTISERPTPTSFDLQDIGGNNPPSYTHDNEVTEPAVAARPHDVDTRRDLQQLAEREQQADEMARLRDALSAQEDRADRLATDLLQSKDHVAQLTVERHQMEEQRAFAEQQKVRSHQTQASNLSVARRFEKENNKKLTRQAPLLEVLTTLEADGDAKQKEIATLEREVKTLQKSIREKDKVIESTTSELEERRRAPEDVTALHNDIKMLLHTIEGLQDENKTLVRIQNAKTQAIEELSNQLEEHNRDDDVATNLRNVIKAKEQREKELIGEMNTLKLAEDNRTKALLREKPDDLVLTAQDWMEERRFLKGQVKKLTETNANHERLAKAQDARVTLLQDRCVCIEKMLKEAKKRRMPSSLLLQRPALSEHPGVSAADAEAAEAAGRDLVPVEMYHFLEMEINTVRAELAEKNVVIAERDDIAEALEHKIDVLTKTRAAENKRNARELSVTKSDLEESRMRCTKLEDELRKKDIEIRTLQLKRKQR